MIVSEYAVHTRLAPSRVLSGVDADRFYPYFSGSVWGYWLKHATVLMQRNNPEGCGQIYYMNSLETHNMITS